MHIAANGAITGGVGTRQAWYWGSAPTDTPTSLFWWGGEAYFIDGVGQTFSVENYPKGTEGSLIRWVGDPRDGRVEIYGEAGRKPRTMVAAGPYWLATRNVSDPARYEAWGQVYSGTYDSAASQPRGVGYSGPTGQGVQDDGSYVLSYTNYGTDLAEYVVYWNDGSTFTIPEGYRFTSIRDNYVMCSATSVAGTPSFVVFDRAGNEVTIQRVQSEGMWPVLPLLIHGKLWLLYYVEHPGRHGLILHPYDDASAIFVFPGSVPAYGVDARIIQNQLIVTWASRAGEGADDAVRYVLPLLPQTSWYEIGTFTTSTATAVGTLTHISSSFNSNTMTTLVVGATDTGAVVGIVRAANGATLQIQTLLTPNTTTVYDTVVCTSMDGAGWGMTYVKSDVDGNGDTSNNTHHFRSVSMNGSSLVLGTSVHIGTAYTKQTPAPLVWDGQAFVVGGTAEAGTVGPYPVYHYLRSNGTILHSGLSLTTPVSLFGTTVLSSIRAIPTNITSTQTGLYAVGTVAWPETQRQMIWSQRLIINESDEIEASGSLMVISSDATPWATSPQIIDRQGTIWTAWYDSTGNVWASSWLDEDRMVAGQPILLAEGQEGATDLALIGSEFIPVVLVVRWNGRIVLIDIATKTPKEVSEISESVTITLDDQNRIVLIGTMIPSGSIQWSSYQTTATGITAIPLFHDTAISRGNTVTSAFAQTAPTISNASALLSNTRIFRQPKSVVPPPSIVSQLGTQAAELLPSTSGTMSELPPAYNAEYPYNNVLLASEAGHLVEVDDTPGAERVHIFHRSGAHIEMRPDGGVKYKSVNTRQDVTIGDHEVIIQGDYKITVDGSCRLLVRNGDLVIESNYGAAVNVKGPLKMSADTIELKAKENIFLNAPSVDLGAFGSTPIISLPGGVLPYPPPGPTSVPVTFVPKVNIGITGGVASTELFRKMPSVGDVVKQPNKMVDLIKRHAKDTSGEPLFSQLVEQPRELALSNPKVYTGKDASHIRYRERQFDTPSDVSNQESYTTHVSLSIELGDYTSTEKDLPGQVMASDTTPPASEPRPYRAFMLSSGGAVSCETGNVMVAGLNTMFEEDILPGQYLYIANSVVQVAAIINNTSLLLTAEWTQSSVQTVEPYVFRLRPFKEFFERYTYTYQSPLGASGLTLGQFLRGFKGPVIEVPKTVATTTEGAGGSGGPGIGPTNPTDPSRGGGGVMPPAI